VRALLAGVIGGLALNVHNPVPHALFAAPWLLWLLTRPDRWRLTMSAAIGYLPWIAVAIGWQHLLGSLDSSSVTAATSAPGGALQAVVQAFRRLLVKPNEGILTVRLIGLTKVWLWAVPAMLVVAAVGFWRRRDDVRFRLLLSSALLTLIGYLFVPFDQGHGWGFRYFHSAWFVLPLFAAAAFMPVETPRGAANALPSRRMAEYLHGTAVGSLVILTAYFGWQVHGFISRHLAQLPRADSGVPRVLIVDPAWGYYAFDLVQNDPFLRGPIVKMLTHGPEDDRAMMARRYPGLVMLGGNYRGSAWGVPDASRSPDPAPGSGGTR
jgi:hypothetical protein